MAVFSAWAGLQIVSAEQKYLEKVVKPHLARLTPLWLSSLREYARLRFEPDISSTSSAALLSQSPDAMYAALNRETLLKVWTSDSQSSNAAKSYSFTKTLGSSSLMRSPA